MAVRITKYPYENEFSTDILLFVLRKSTLRFDFLKFTFAVRSRLGGNMATCRVAKRSFDRARTMKTFVTSAREASHSICAKSGGVFANFTATHREAP